MAEIEMLENELAGMDDEEVEKSDFPARLEVLRSLDSTDDAAAILGEQTVVFAVRSVLRRDAYRRGRLQQESRRWLMDQAGVDDYRLIDFSKLPDGAGDKWMALFQATDVVAAIVPEKCSGWDVPKDLDGWANVEDWLFTRILEEVWALNPQFTTELSGEA